MAACRRGVPSIERVKNMANRLKLNTHFEKSAKLLVDKGIMGPGVKHDWTTMRHLAWAVIVAQVLPEFGVDASKAGQVEVKDKDGKAVMENGKPKMVPNETLENLMNARKAFNEAFDDGYTLESSNCGKHLADHGFVRSSEKEAKQAADFIC
jgi:hypothetical protein